MGDIEIRDAGPDDEPVMWDALAYAVAWRPGSRLPSVAELQDDVALSHYVWGWAQAGDLGVVAWSGERPLGAAWLRTLTADGPGYGFLVAGIPELSMGVVPDRRGEGVGGMLLDALLARADAAGVPGESLSVEDGNDVAAWLYHSRGFVPVGRTGASDLLLRGLPSYRFA